MGACSSDDAGTTSTTVAITTPLAGRLTAGFSGDPCTAAGEEVAVVISARGEMGDLGTVQLRVDATALCGTGRFAGATGQETVTYLHDFTNMELTLVVDGEISTSN